jgi:hypothetical protein
MQSEQLKYNENVRDSHVEVLDGLLSIHHFAQKWSSEWLSGSSTSMGVSMWVSLRPMSRRRARVARVNDDGGCQIEGTEYATLRWPLVPQAASGSATSLGGEKTRSASGTVQHKPVIDTGESDLWDRK